MENKNIEEVILENIGNFTRNIGRDTLFEMGSMNFIEDTPLGKVETKNIEDIFRSNKAEFLAISDVNTKVTAIGDYGETYYETTFDENAKFLALVQLRPPKMISFGFSKKPKLFKVDIEIYGDKQAFTEHLRQPTT